MSEYLIDKSNIEKDFATLADEVDMIIDAGGQARVKLTKASSGTWPMLKLWRKWMDQIANHMNNRGRSMPLYIDENGKPQGRRPMTGDDCHHAYTHLALGCDENGVRLSWALSEAGSDEKRVASTGERLRAMEKIWFWAMNEGIPLINPENTEYRKLQDQQNG